MSAKRTAMGAGKGAKEAGRLRRARFVEEYLKDFNVGLAYERAGFKTTGQSAKVCGCRLLRDPKVLALLRARNGKHLAQVGLKVEDVIEAIRRQVVANPKALFDEHGDVRPIHTLSDEAAAMILAWEYVMKNAEAGDGKIDHILKIKRLDPSKYVELGARYFGLLQDKLHVTGDWDKFAARLAAARTRLKRPTQ